MAGTEERVQVNESARVRPATVAEMLDRLRADRSADQEIVADKRYYVTILNREELAVVGNVRAELRQRCRYEGMTSENDILAVLDELAPNPAVQYRIQTTAEGADHVLVHEGDTITHRELARFGVHPDDLDGIKRKGIETRSDARVVRAPAIELETGTKDD